MIKPLSLLVLSLLIGSMVHADERPPNVVFIVADDLGWTDLGAFGSDFHQTPHIDALAQQGMKFTSAYASPNCAPTRACLMSGQYTPRHGVYTVGSPFRGQAEHRKLVPPHHRVTLPPGTTTWAAQVKKAGYFTAHLGKWHLGNPPQSGPETHGFDVNIAGFEVGTPPGGYFVPYRNPYLQDGPEGEYLTDRLVEEAVTLIRENHDKPFFIYLPHYAPHTPIQAKPEDIELYELRQRGENHRHPVYAAMIHSVDEGVSRIMATLQELGIDDHTIVIFYSDNGPHQRFSNAVPLRDGKGTLYEGGIRVPLIIRWPGVTVPGAVCDEPVHHIDFSPTFLDIAGVSEPDNHVLDGRSLLPLLRQGGEGRLDREAIYWHKPGYLEAYMPDRRWRLTPATAMRARDWKLIEFFEDGRLELYNLKEDIGEQNDLAESMPQVRDRLHAKMRAWREELNALMPTEKSRQ